MINQQLLDFIKQQLQTNVPKEKIIEELLANGWSKEDVHEGFNNLNTPNINMLDNRAPIPEEKKRSGGKIFLIILLIILLGGGAGLYYFRDSLINLSIIEKVIDFKNKMLGQEEEMPIQVEEEAEIVQEENSSLILDSNIIEQSGPIKLLSLTNGQKIISDSNINVKYETTEDNVDGIIMVGGCIQKISGKLKGEYSFDCKVQKKLGPIKASVADLKNISNLDKNTIDIEVIAPAEAKPVEIIRYVDTGFLTGMTGNDSTYIALGIKYNDGVIREIPFKYIQYSLDDPSLISFLNTENTINTYAQHYVANKGGRTILHLEYQGIKKDIPVQTCSPNNEDYPC